MNTQISWWAQAAGPNPFYALIARGLQELAKSQSGNCDIIWFWGRVILDGALYGFGEGASREIGGEAQTLKISKYNTGLNKGLPS